MIENDDVIDGGAAQNVIRCRPSLIYPFNHFMYLYTKVYILSGFIFTLRLILFCIDFLDMFMFFLLHWIFHHFLSFFSYLYFILYFYF